jgi:hypothetical protein
MSARTFTTIMLAAATVFTLAALGTLVDNRPHSPLFAFILIVLASYCAIAAWCCPKIRGWR